MIADKIRCCVCVYVRVCVYFRPRMSVKEASKLKGVWVSMNERKPEQGMSAHLAPGGLRQNIRSFPVLSVRWRKKKTILMVNQKMYPSLVNIEISITKMKLVTWKRWKNAICTKTTPGPIYKPVSHNVLFSCVLFFPLKPELLQRAISRLFKHKFTSLAWYCCIVASEREEFINM